MTMRNMKADLVNVIGDLKGIISTSIPFRSHLVGHLAAHGCATMRNTKAELIKMVGDLKGILVEIEIQKQIDAGTLERVKAKKVKRDSELTIQEFIPKFLRDKNILTRDSLNEWCEMKGARAKGDDFLRSPLYSLYEKTSPSEYARQNYPKHIIRATYEMYLEGYKIKSKDL